MAVKTTTITLDTEMAAMLFELCSKAGAIGSDAAILGRLYAQAKAATDRLPIPKARVPRLPITEAGDGGA